MWPQIPQTLTQWLIFLVGWFLALFLLMQLWLNMASSYFTNKLQDHLILCLLSTSKMHWKKLIWYACSHQCCHSLYSTWYFGGNIFKDINNIGIKNFFDNSCINQILIQIGWMSITTPVSKTKCILLFSMWTDCIQLIWINIL